jgi:ribosomal-protein-alanine N-acetyltransferase
MITFSRIDKQVSGLLTQQLLLLQQACFSPPWSITQIEQQLSSNRGYNFALFDGQQIIGFLYCQYVFDEIEILQVAISASMRGQGLGRKLISQLLTFINDANKQTDQMNTEAPKFTHTIVRVLLEVRASNAAAISLYSSLGFELDGTRKGYYPALLTGDCAEDAKLYSLVIHSSKIRDVEL